MSGVELTTTIIKSVVLLAILMTAAAYLVLLGALDRRLGAGPPRAQPRGHPADEDPAVRPGAAAGRRAEVHLQGRVHAQPTSTSSCTRWRRFRFSWPRWLSFAVIPFGSVLPPFDVVGTDREPIDLVVAPGIDVGMIYVFALSQHRRLRRDPRRLGQQQQVQLSGRAAIERPVDRLRAAAGVGHPGRRAVCRLAAARDDHRPAGRKRRVERLRCSRWASWCSWWRRSPKPPGCRSTCPRPSRN